MRGLIAPHLRHLLPAFGSDVLKYAYASLRSAGDEPAALSTPSPAALTSGRDASLWVAVGTGAAALPRRLERCSSASLRSPGYLLCSVRRSITALTIRGQAIVASA